MNADEVRLVSSGRVGVGGASLQASKAGPAQRSGSAALDAVSRWSARLDHGWPAADFPDLEIVTHYRSAGRTQAHPGLAALLRDVHDRSVVASPLLRTWLPMTFDQVGGDYDSYVGAQTLAAAVAGGAGGTHRMVDVLVCLAVVDLATVEASALAVTEDRAQLVRTRAAARVLAHLPELAPDAALRFPETDELMAAIHSAGDSTGQLLAELATVGSALLRAAPGEVAKAIQLTMLPTTRLHDEQMFIRCIQIFEGVYLQVLGAVTTAITALLDGDGVVASAELDRAAARVEATPVLYRVLTTMPIDAFAVIRACTHGRSAIQSYPFRAVEAMSAPRADTRGVTPDGPTLQEVYASRGGRLPGEVAAGVAASMARLDRAWRGMKRSHWGLTLKIIGQVPGTGGTAGASYLRESADIPLFPLLRGRKPAA